jgi:allophycocyanin-B
MSVITQVLLQADDELRYPTLDELQSIRDFLQTGAQRVRVVSVLTENEAKIVKKATEDLWKIHPEYIAPGGNAAGARQRAQCIRDYGWYLRLITYGILAGDKQPIEEIGIIGVREMYNNLNVPLVGMADAIRCLKEASLALLTAEEAALAEPYFDYVIQAMSS